MSREITSAQSAAAAAASVRCELFCLLDFAGGVVRLWTGQGETSWGGATWLGVGTFGGVSPVEETRSVQANGVQLSLSGIPSELVALALTEHYRGRQASLWLALYNTTTGAMLDTPLQIFSGIIDTMELNDSGETSTIVLSVESRLIDLERTRERRYTDEDQQELYPGDLAFEFVESLQNKDIRWGVAPSLGMLQGSPNGGTWQEALE